MANGRARVYPRCPENHPKKQLQPLRYGFPWPRVTHRHRKGKATSLHSSTPTSVECAPNPPPAKNRTDHLRSGGRRFALNIHAQSVPKMIEMRQSYPPSPKLDFAASLEQQFAQQGLRAKIRPGMRIALGVGSRGITNLKEIVKATLGVLMEAGAQALYRAGDGEPRGRDRGRPDPGAGRLWGHGREHGRPYRSQHGGKDDWHGTRWAGCGLQCSGACRPMGWWC